VLQAAQMVEAAVVQAAPHAGALSRAIAGWREGVSELRELVPQLRDAHATLMTVTTRLVLARRCARLAVARERERRSAALVRRLVGRMRAAHIPPQSKESRRCACTHGPRGTSGSAHHSCGAPGDGLWRQAHRRRRCLSRRRDAGSFLDDIPGLWTRV
jgi:hypothetical protein